MGMIAKKQETALANAAAAKPQTLVDYVNLYQDRIQKALPSVGITPERFTRLVLSAASNNPTLQECTPKSFLAAMMTCAQMGMEPNTPLGQAYLIPYKNYKANQTECQYQLGYKGLIELAHRSGCVNTIFAEVVYENDLFEYELGIDARLVHKPCMKGPRGNAVCYYAVWKGKDGGYGFAVMSKEDVIQHRQKFSKAKNSPWDTNFDEMAKKTVLKKALKYAPLSIDFQRQLSADETVKETVSDNMLDEPMVMPDPIEAEGSVTESEVPEEPINVDPETGEILQ